MAKLQGKTAYITGSGRGIGRAVALKLASEGANIVVNDLDAEPAHEVVDQINETYGANRAIAVPGSVSDDDFAERFINAGIEAYGSIDIIVNNAGYTWDSMIGKMTDQQFDAMMDVHLKAPFCILRSASSHMIPQAKIEAEQDREVFRKVVNISSIAGLGGNPGQTNYASAKAGIEGMTKTLAKEWGRYKINVNCIAFGYIETRLTEATDEKRVVEVEGNKIGLGIPVKVSKGFAAAVPMGRAGTPQEAADGVYLLCCPESNYVSGQTLVVGGGLLL